MREEENILTDTMKEIKCPVKLLSRHLICSDNQQGWLILPLPQELGDKPGITTAIQAKDFSAPKDTIGKWLKETGKGRILNPWFSRRGHTDIRRRR